MSTPATALVVGADGVIGRALMAHLDAAGIRAVGTTRREAVPAGDRLFLDLSVDPSGWPLPAGVAVAYLCAAVTSGQACRAAPDRTALVNVVHTAALAGALAAQGARVVLLSTSAVFDGSVPFQKAEAPYRPSTEYGRQKAEAEKALLRLGDAATIVRLTKVWGPVPALLEPWARALRAGEVVRPFSDMVVAPLPVEFVAGALVEIGLHGIPGILQLSGAEDISYADVARRLASRLGVSTALVQPISAAEAGLDLEAVPLHTTLDDSRARSVLGICPPSVWQAVDTAVGGRLSPKP